MNFLQTFIANELENVRRFPHLNDVDSVKGEIHHSGCSRPPGKRRRHGPTVSSKDYLQVIYLMLELIFLYLWFRNRFFE